MKTVGEQNGGTAARVLEAASKAFAEKGYHEATISQICDRAGANIAAVNYYFGDKQTLYAEAWRLAFRRSTEAHPPDGGVAPDAPAEERLRGRILSLMERIFDPESHEFEVVHKEMANPTGLLIEAMKESIDPIRQELFSIVQELLGERVPERHVLLCQRSIMAQCFDLMRAVRHGARLGKTAWHPAAQFPQLNVCDHADHVIRFSLAGIRAIREQAERGELEGEE